MHNHGQVPSRLRVDHETVALVQNTADDSGRYFVDVKVQQKATIPEDGEFLPATFMLRSEFRNHLVRDIDPQRLASAPVFHPRTFERRLAARNPTDRFPGLDCRRLVGPVERQFQFFRSYDGGNPPDATACDEGCDFGSKWIWCPQILQYEFHALPPTISVRAQASPSME
jgi:hypothetical protein